MSRNRQQRYWNATVTFQYPMFYEAARPRRCRIPWTPVILFQVRSAEILFFVWRKLRILERKFTSIWVETVVSVGFSIQTLSYVNQIWLTVKHRPVDGDDILISVVKGRDRYLLYFYNILILSILDTLRSFCDTFSNCSVYLKFKSKLLVQFFWLCNVSFQRILGNVRNVA